MIELLSDQRVFDGQYFIIFDAQDKQTGIDHYEVLESEPGAESAGESGRSDLIRRFIKGKTPQWKVAQSPYLLEDQKLQSEVHVKAVDKAGNERTVKYFPEESKRAAASGGFPAFGNMLSLSIAIIIILFLVLAAVLVRAGIKFKQKKDAKQ